MSLFELAISASPPLKIKSSVEIYTDGSCNPNPGSGGWAAILLSKTKILEIWGSEDNTTSNRMEITGCIKALECLKHPCNVIIYSDSQYVCKGMTPGTANWDTRMKKIRLKKKLINHDLWDVLDSLCKQHKVVFQWVKGHNGHQWNERADFLANSAMKGA